MWKASPRCVSDAAVSKLQQCTLSDKPCDDYDFCEWLWTETKDTRTIALNTNFVQGVKDGMLHPTSFGKVNLWRRNFFKCFVYLIRVTHGVFPEGPHL